MRFHTPVHPNPALHTLADLLRGRRVVVLTGAGVSTDSGIPDYRGPKTRHKARNPLRWAQFTASADRRRSYWARSALGWPRVDQARPNATHHALAELEARGHVVGIITQNVDGLHQKAGSRSVVELHGALRRVVCLGCGQTTARADLQARFAPHISAPVPQRLAAPDGDADVDIPARFPEVTCRRCAGALKPDVVFFGENVPARTTSDAWSMYGQAEVLLVLGSSLAVFSGYRFVHRARRDALPVAVVTLGPTRADDHVTCRIDAPLASVVPHLLPLLEDG